MLEPIAYVCPYCAQSIETVADPSQGSRQAYVEDCQVCCRPLQISVTLDERGVPIAIAEPESD